MQCREVKVLLMFADVDVTGGFSQTYREYTLRDVGAISDGGIASISFKHPEYGEYFHAKVGDSDAM